MRPPQARGFNPFPAGGAVDGRRFRTGGHLKPACAGNAESPLDGFGRRGLTWGVESAELPTNAVPSANRLAGNQGCRIAGKKITKALRRRPHRVRAHFGALLSVCIHPQDAIRRGIDMPRHCGSHSTGNAHASCPAHVRHLAREGSEPVRMPVGEAISTCSPAMPEASGDALAQALRSFRNFFAFSLWGLTGATGLKYAGSLDRWIAGSLDRWIAGSLDRWIAGSLDRWIAQRHFLKVAHVFRGGLAPVGPGSS